MTKNDIFTVVKNKIEEILPEVPSEMIVIDEKLKRLGANSIDRVEILTLSLEHLGLKVPLVEFGACKNIKDMVEKLYLHQSE